jgi:hypothetical protein
MRHSVDPSDKLIRMHRVLPQVLRLALAPLLLFSCAHSGVHDPRYSGHDTLAVDRAGRTCRPLSAEERERVLSFADPKNFPTTRYRKGPNWSRGIEKETDCSQFVYEIYKRAGLPFRFKPTTELGNAREFDVLPEKDAQPGDLMLFRGHVGIVDENGKIISALKTRRRRRKSSIAAIDRRYFKSIHGQRYVLRYRCPPFEEQLAARAIAGRTSGTAGAAGTASSNQGLSRTKK